MNKTAAEPVICVTGASSGIGLATARWFANKNYHLITAARRVDRLKGQASELMRLGAASVLPLCLDIRSLDSISAFMAAVVERHPEGPRILINNAGLALGRERLVDGKDEDWLQMIQTNITGTLWLTRAVLRQMLPNQIGHIVMVGSIAGHQVYEGGAVYCATKHGMRAISETLKLELNGTGVRVSSIDPGMVETEFSLVRFHQNESEAKKVYQGITPLTAEDVAETIGFVVTRPPHVNIDQIVLTPTDQATVYKVHRHV